jgi:SAM-dependent methyltransferase
LQVINMPTLEWLRGAYASGYDSGNILSAIPNVQRWREERKIGGSYHRVFKEAALPYLRPEARVLELGPGSGSWSRAILRHLPRGELRTVDFQDVTPWLKPEQYGGRLVCHQTIDNSFADIPAGYFDFLWSFGVFCHNNQSAIAEILANTLKKMKPGAYAVHQYGDWQKLDAFGWRRGKVPVNFKRMPDDEIWWPRNDKDSMRTLAVAAGWEVLSADLGLIRRDSIILLRCPLSQPSA